MYLVKNKETGLFLGSHGWTPRSNEAYKFPNGLSIVLHLNEAETDPATVDIIPLS